MARFSIRRLGEVTGRSLRRFPLAVLAAVVAGVAGVVAVDADGPSRALKLLLTAQLGIPLFLAAALLGERHAMLRLPPVAGVVARVSGVVLLVAYDLSLPRELDMIDMLRFVQFNVGLHMLVAVVPFARRGETNGMWQYNLAVLLRFMTAVFFSAVLFAGLSLAIAALDTLLGVDVDDKLYMQLWVLIAFIFNTTYFLGGVPHDFSALDGLREYPRVVRIFAQYILAPLVVVYLAILLAYLVKVIATAVWPSGWIGYLVSSVAAAGLLSLLLLKPRAELPDQRWLRLYTRLFYVLMLPAVTMLALAVFKRTSQYGVTEPRYFLGVLTLWLAVVTLTGCVRPRVPLRAIPASLAALAFLTAFGPWSAYGLSRSSQLARLDALLVSHGRLAGGSLVAGGAEVSFDDRREISAALDYLFDHHGPRALGRRVDPALQASLDEVADRLESKEPTTQGLTDVVTEYLALPYVSSWQEEGRSSYSFDRDRGGEALVIQGFERLVEFGTGGDDVVSFTIDGDSCRVVLAWENQAVSVAWAQQPALVLDLAPVIAALRVHAEKTESPPVPAALLTAAGETEVLRASLQIDHIDWQEEDDSITGGSLRGVLLLAARPEVHQLVGPAELRGISRGLSHEDRNLVSLTCDGVPLVRVRGADRLRRR